ncbi:type I-F CRISPR-associated protein Csy2 [Methylovulum psychrotolerans]|uniref:Type I-F CRISPR-associated protein Csy2 n=1 Tax=Methylovulum psychrotolerans TaxID=1704499 RepID=A0A1Z4C407_9GAMM|nr:type I-F CRISPR-associated protein Csy2 [Methylovulum psychrotolerans]ASF48263.1 type I-F CRISPR-associated protein Csy2 [Methylovulum psychrotolerans]
MRRFLLIPHIKIHNANAMSSPYTIGFPAMTAWLGAVHALQRHIQKHELTDVQLISVAVSCHQLDLQTYKGQGDFVSSIVSTANPLDKDGSRPAFIEEARCHLDVTLLIEYKGLDSDDVDKFTALANAQLLCMKLASGDVLSAGASETLYVDEDEEQDLKKLLKKLMLGYVLIERRDLMITAMQKEGKDALESLLDHLKIMYRATQGDEGKATWTNSRKTSGWLVPIAVGFQGISELGTAKNQRDTETQHRFAESVVTLGEFIMPYRIKNVDDILWQYHVDTEQNLYLCQTLSTSNNLGD